MLLELIPFPIPWKSANSEHEARVSRLLEVLDSGDLAIPDVLPDDAREHLAQLDTCDDGLACLVQHASTEEPSFYLPGVLRPSWLLLSSAPFVGHSGGPSRRDFARTVLRVAALLGGDARLGVMAMVSGEDAIAAHHAEVYPRVLARVASLVSWAVLVLESEGAADEFVAEHIVESAPRLAAARFIRSQRVSWPSLEPSWALTVGLPTEARETSDAWNDVDRRLGELTDAIESIESAEKTPRASSERPAPGTLVFVPAKGVTVVLEHFGDHDVVAHWSRPARTDTWYPAASLAALPIEPPPFNGSVPFEVAYAAKRALQNRIFEIRIKRGARATSFVRIVRGALDDTSGLESETGRAYVDEGEAREADDPSSMRVLAGHAKHALEHYLRDLLVHCDPVLGRVALERAIRLADRVVSEGAKDFNLRSAHLVRATCAWVVGRDEDRYADAFADGVVSKLEDPDFTMLMGLMSVGRDSAIEEALATAAWRTQRDTWKEEADDWSDLKTSNWAERALRIVRIAERFVEAGLDAGLAEDIRGELARPRRSLVLDLEQVLWLRTLHAGRDWTPRQIVLSSYFELPDFQSISEIPREPPKELAAEVEALEAAVSRLG